MVSFVAKAGIHWFLENKIVNVQTCGQFWDNQAVIHRNLYFQNLFMQA